MQFATVLLVLNDYMLPCFSKQIFGFDCPGCGLQRSVVLLFQGNLAEAFYMYPAIFTLIPLFSLLLMDSVFKIKFSKIITITLAIASVCLILGNYIIKLI